MAKDKAFEKQYKEEGKRRMHIRKEKRKEILRKAMAKRNEFGCPLYAVRGNNSWWNNSWSDSTSSTGYRQICSYWATCESPCNGDC